MSLAAKEDAFKKPTNAANNLRWSHTNICHTTPAQGCLEGFQDLVVLFLNCKWSQLEFYLFSIADILIRARRCRHILWLSMSLHSVSLSFYSRSAFHELPHFTSSPRAAFLAIIEHEGGEYVARLTVLLDYNLCLSCQALPRVKEESGSCSPPTPGGLMLPIAAFKHTFITGLTVPFSLFPSPPAQPLEEPGGDR